MAASAGDAGFVLGIPELDAQHERLIALLDDIESFAEQPDDLPQRLEAFAAALREHLRSEEAPSDADAEAHRRDPVAGALLAILGDRSWIASGDRRREHIAYIRAWLHDHLVNHPSHGAPQPPRTPSLRYRLARAATAVGVTPRVGLLAALPLAAMLTVVVLFALVGADRAERAEQGARYVNFMVAVNDLIHAVQVERGQTAMALAGGPAVPDGIATSDKVETLFTGALDHARQVDHDDHGLADNIAELRDAAAALRRSAADGGLDWTAAYEDYTTLIAALNALNNEVAAHIEGSLSYHASLLSQMTEIREWGGRERALGSATLADGAVPAHLAATMRALAERQRLVAQLNAPPLLQHAGLPARAVEDAVRSDELSRLRDAVQRSAGGTLAHDVDPRHWFAVTSERLDRIKALQDRIADGAIATATRLRDDTRATMHLTLSVSGAILALVALALWVIGNSLLVPLDGLAATARRLAKGERLLPVPATDFTDQAGDLARAFAFLRNRIVAGELSSATMQVQGQNRLFHIASSIPGVVYERRLNGADESTLTFISDQVERYTGVPAAELVGRPFEVFVDRVVHPDDRAMVRQHGGILHNGAGAGESEFRLLSRNGDPVTVRALFVDHLQADGTSVRRGVAVDVTELKTAHARLQALSRIQAMSQITGSLAHEINNLLQPIVGYGEFAKRALADDDPARKHLDAVLSAADQAKDIIANTLAFGRGDSIERGAVDLRDVIGEVMRLIGPLVPNQIRLRADIRAPGCTVLANRTEVAQILVNLATNACHAMNTRGGELVIGVAMEDGDEAGKPQARLFVQDTGPGIPPGVLDRLTDLFQTTKQPGKGTGMGLALVRLLVSDLGGTMRVDSAQGAGTRFDILLPLLHD